MPNVYFNSSPPSATYMRQWLGSELVQIMACRLFGAKPLSKQCWIVNWTLRNKLQWKFNQNMKLFIHKTALENVRCEMTAILSRRRWVNKNILYVFSNPSPCCFIPLVLTLNTQPLCQEKYGVELRNPYSNGKLFNNVVWTKDHSQRKT